LESAVLNPFSNSEVSDETTDVLSSSVVLFFWIDRDSWVIVGY